MAGSAEVTWSPFTKGYYGNPYQHLADCRRTYPIQKSPVLEDSWFFFAYEDVSTLLRAPDMLPSDLSEFFAQKETQIFRNGGGCPFLAKGTAKWPMYLSGTEHKVLRVLIGKAFKELDVSGIISRALATHFENYELQAGFDLVDFSAEFIFLIVRDFFGIDDRESLAEIREYSSLLARSQDLYIPRPVYQQINASFLWGRKLFSQSAFRKRMVALTEEAGLHYSDDDIYSVMSVMLMASFETSKDNLAASLFEILKNPKLIEYALESDQKQLNVLIEELIRFSSPLQYTIRKNKEELHYKGHVIPADSRLFLCLASANRDPAVFENPEEIIPDRYPNDHLSFGFGLHFCLGSQIARQELRYCLKPMVQYLKDFTLNAESEVEWGRQIFMRTLESAPIAKPEPAAHA